MHKLASRGQPLEKCLGEGKGGWDTEGKEKFCYIVFLLDPLLCPRKPSTREPGKAAGEGDSSMSSAKQKSLTMANKSVMWPMKTSKWLSGLKAVLRQGRSPFG